MPRQRVALEFLEMDDVDVSTCLVCRCTDMRACPGGCSWHTVDREKRTGICSRCVGKKIPRRKKASSRKPQVRRKAKK